VAANCEYVKNIELSVWSLLLLLTTTEFCWQISISFSDVNVVVVVDKVGKKGIVVCVEETVFI
jgi:hypothetical protein